MRIRFEYQYRDGSNYKQQGHVNFDNATGMTVEEIDDRLRDAFDSGEDFIARQIDIPEVFFSGFDEDDGCWHEYTGVVNTDSTHDNDGQNRDIKRFVEEVEAAAKKGWDAYIIEVVETPVPKSGAPIRQFYGARIGTALAMPQSERTWLITYTDRKETFLFIGTYLKATEAAEELRGKVSPPVPVEARAKIVEVTGYKTRSPTPHDRAAVNRAKAQKSKAGKAV